MGGAESAQWQDVPQAPRAFQGLLRPAVELAGSPGGMSLPRTLLLAFSQLPSVQCMGIF